MEGKEPKVAFIGILNKKVGCCLLHLMSPLESANNPQEFPGRCHPSGFSGWAEWDKHGRLRFFRPPNEDACLHDFGRFRGKIEAARSCQRCPQILGTADRADLSGANGWSHDKCLLVWCLRTDHEYQLQVHCCQEWDEDKQHWAEAWRWPGPRGKTSVSHSL